MADYRSLARRELSKAQVHIASGDNECLKYAALELRMAMESLTYDRALAYKDEFPAKEYETWQPRRVMAVLLEIDPSADRDSSISFGIEPSYGVTPDVMESLGTEVVLNMATLKKHYDALGSYLHVPTIKQQRDGVSVDFSKLRMRIEEIAIYLSTVLSSPVWNATIGNFASIECIECGKVVRKRFPPGMNLVAVGCQECGSTYKITDVGDGKVNFEPDQVELRCGNKDCSAVIHVWPTQIEQNVGWTCEVCGGRNIIRMAIFHEPIDTK